MEKKDTVLTLEILETNGSTYPVETLEKILKTSNNLRLISFRRREATDEDKKTNNLP